MFHRKNLTKYEEFRFRRELEKIARSCQKCERFPGNSEICQACDLYVRAVALMKVVSSASNEGA